MSRRFWLLVEWLGENDVFSNYDVVNSDLAMGGETDFGVGKNIFLQQSKGPRRAKILKICDKKRYLKELKLLLEKQDAQMKNVLSLCVNTLKDMKTNTIYLDSQSNRVEESESSEDDDEENENKGQEVNFSKLTNKFSCKRSSLTTSRHQNLSGIKQTPFSRKRSLISSTPFPEMSKLTFDQATQTDATIEPNVVKVEHLEILLKKLYHQFLSLIGETPANMIQNSAAVEYSETEISEMDNQSEEATVKEESLTTSASLISMDKNDDKSKQAKRLCIRRASAQTTNIGLSNSDPDTNICAVCQIYVSDIGAGSTKLPVTVINSIDWSSYSTATRQLLQAIFPRKVLATRSLTGKQSPAFANKPPKKALDSDIVNDIVDTVSDVCGVSKRIVRSCITTKCTDEAKLYRNRQQYKPNNDSRETQENSTTISPSSINEIISKKE